MKYYIEKKSPVITDAGTFAGVQEEIARWACKPNVKQKEKIKVDFFYTDMLY